MSRKLQNLTDRHFGKWLVLKRSEDRSGLTMWLCRCDPEVGGCGSEKPVATISLLRDRSHCCRRCSATERHRKDQQLRQRMQEGLRRKGS
jgi:hypothetical protein